MKNLRPRFQAITSTLSCTLVLLLTGLTLLSVQAARCVREYVNENFVITLTLGGNSESVDEEEGTTSPTINTMKGLSAERFVKDVKLITADEVLAEQIEIIGNDPQEFLGFNPFYNELEVNICADFANSDSMEVVEKEIAERYPLVSEIDYEKDLAENLSQNIRRVTYFLTALTILLLIILLTLINNMVHLSIYARRFHIHTMKLVGASRNFIRRPFIRRSFCIGLAAGILADALLLAFVRWMDSYDEAFATIISVRNVLPLLLFIPLVGCLLLLLCTFLSVNHFIKMKEHRLYD